MADEEPKKVRRVVKKKVVKRKKAPKAEDGAADGAAAGSSSGDNHGAGDGPSEPTAAPAPASAPAPAPAVVAAAAAAARPAAAAAVAPAVPSAAERAAALAAQEREAAAAAAAATAAAEEATRAAADDETGAATVVIATIVMAGGTNTVRVAVTERTEYSHLKAKFARKLSLLETEFFELGVRDGSGAFTRWLEPSVPILSQGLEVDSGLLRSELVFRVKFFAADITLSSDMVAVTLLYNELRGYILSGAWPVTSDQAVRLAAFSFQDSFGDYRPAEHGTGFLESSLGQLVPLVGPLASLSRKQLLALESGIYARAAHLRGVAPVFARMSYCEFARGLPCYGLVYFSLSGGPAPWIGVSPDGVGAYASTATANAIEMWPVASIGAVELAGDAVTLRLADGRVKTLTGAQAREVAELVAGYRAIAQTGLIRGNAAARRPPCTLRVRVRDADPASKLESFTINQTTTIQALTDLYVDRIGLDDRRWFGLCVAQDDGDRWLNPARLVMDEHVLESTVLVFQLRVIVLTGRELVRSRDAVAKSLYFKQFKSNVLKGSYVVTERQAVQLAAYAFMLIVGPYAEPDPSNKTVSPIHTSGYIEHLGIETFIPSYLQVRYKNSQWESLIRAAWQAMGNVGDSATVQAMYLEVTLSLPSFGTEYFFVERSTGEQRLLGVSAKGLVEVEPQHYDAVELFPWPVTKVTNGPATVNVARHARDAPPVSFAYLTASPMQAKAIKVLCDLYQVIAFRAAQANKRE